MLTFTVLPDREKFLSLARHSRGAVLLHLPDGSVCDLRRDNTARQLLLTMAPGQGGLRVSLADRGTSPPSSATCRRRPSARRSRRVDFYGALCYTFC